MGAGLTSRRALLLLSSPPPLGAALLHWVRQLAEAHDEVVVVLDEGGAHADAATLPARWAALRTLLAEQARVWVTPLVRAPGLDTRADQLAALTTRLGHMDAYFIDDAALLPLLGRLGLTASLLPSLQVEPGFTTHAAHARRALVVMRAQPFHRGHLALVEHALSLVDEVVVLVAAAERAYTTRDPFSAGERLALVRVGLGKHMARTWLLAVPSPVWPGMALTQLAFVAPAYELVVAHNPVLLAMAQALGQRVTGLLEPVRINGEVVSATAIRARLVEQGAGPWLHNVMPPASAALLASSPALATRCGVLAEQG